MKIVLHYEAGELEFKMKLRSRGITAEYVGDEPDYWSRDIDFITEDGIAYEVKWDSWIDKTNNLFIEIANPRSKGGQGWYKFCEADFLAYGNARKNEFYVIRMAELKNYIDTVSPNLITTNDGAKGYLINKEELNYETY